MKFIILILLLINIKSSFSQDSNPFKSLSTNNQDTPYLITLMLQHLQSVTTPQDETVQILKDLSRINTNFQNMNKLNKLFLVTSESQKSILNFKYDNQLKSNSVMTAELALVEAKLKKNALIYTDFSEYIITEVTKDFEEFLEDGFLDNYQNSSSVNSKKIVKIAKLRKRIKYSGPWVHSILTAPAKSFNEQLSFLISTFFRNLAEQSLLFTLHKTPNNAGEAPTMFIGLNDIRVKNYISGSASITPDQDSTEIQKKAKKEAIEDIKKLKIIVPANPSQDIDNLIKNIDK
jgi:hypothetical protein